MNGASRSTTIKDVAKYVGISVTAVSQILNGKGERFSKETIRKVQEAQRVLNYHPNFYARGLVGRRSNSIGIVIPNIMNPFFASLVLSVENAAIPRGIFPQVFSVNGFHENIDYFIEQFISGTQKGLILAAPGASQEIVDKLASNNLPMVLTDQADLSGKYDMVLINELKAGEMIAGHLLELGHTRIAIVLPFGLTLNLKHRFDGYKLAFKKYDVEIPFDLIFQCGFDPSGGVDAVKKIIETDATAIIAINDDVAIGVYRGLALHKKKIPEDYSVVGFDNISLTEYLTPGLTTIEQPIEDIGEQAVQMLANKMDDSNMKPQFMILDVRLIVRDSTKKLEM
ncbi:LacI family DNA-binding transcriptional regulator [Companilactobacillus insicii]|uniref:LacI family DNA-binding transcriptional regulator n=1 Tax=Companilactobacillus insicii TaxID=1732567 RepID=UPI001FE35DE1|nr:LacI family DNA-binding transcriptional regulator [Companilactobacillus insicii]